MVDEARKSVGFSDAFEAVKEAVRRLESDNARRFEEGRASMAQDILEAINGILNPKNTLVAALPIEQKRKRAKPLRKAANGIAAQAISSVFRDDEGLSIGAIHKKATALGFAFSNEAVGNELRRYEGVKYRRESGKWFPLRDTVTTSEPRPHTEKASDANASEAQSDQPASHAA